MARWQDGRHGTGYKKLLLAQSACLRLDAWLLDYPPGATIPPHRDHVQGRRHFRLNVLLRGEQTFHGNAIAQLGRVVFFRPDTTMHTVTRSEKRRLVLSIGFAL